MDILLPAVWTKLHNDSALGGYVSGVRQWRVPEDPSKLAMPVVVIRGAGGNDQAGLHGAALNVDIEAEVWAYGKTQHKSAWQAARRVSELFTEGAFSLSTGTTTRWGEALAWQQIDQDDPDTILLRATFRARYWPTGRATEVAKN